MFCGNDEMQIENVVKISPHLRPEWLLSKTNKIMTTAKTANVIQDIGKLQPLGTVGSVTWCSHHITAVPQRQKHRIDLQAPL